ncbi:hypothetical protein LTR64_007762 [Lithohypha guttulata]|uniref:uncharacterized protein n=1 Tax=Lithohypha guttulata TaxID=1690604 RepID=UPI002DDF49D3|nr:hypothetical protein LTR51_007272 [Lithohypha guttulata]
MGEMSQDEDVHLLADTNLSEGWAFRQTDRTEDEWLPVKKIPSTVHQDLIDNKKLDDPFIGFNEIKAEWVGTKSWIYKKTFKRPNVPAGAIAVLAFDGLDTFAHVRLNGKTILESDNMFLPYRVNITHSLSSDIEQELEVEFDSALLKAREIKAQHPEHKFVGFNGDPARMGVRKAQYHWGWDWGPVLMCAGIWRPVTLEIYSTKIADVRIEQDLSADYKRASTQVTMELEGHVKEGYSAEVSLSLNGKLIKRSSSETVHDNTFVLPLEVEDVQLWMPNGYGKQNLYDVQAQIISENGDQIHTVTKRIGFRRVELIQRPDRHGKSFFFRVNGVDIFCGGSCWIPSDSFLTNVTPERLRSWMQLMVPANQKMIRVWGGGIFEEDAFYDACDELGILVWQDFLFACGNYGCWPTMLQSIEAEAVANVRRLRHHPCLAIFAGNNEDYQVREQSGLTYNYGDKDESNWLKTDFPARYIYEALLPRVMAKELPSVPYHPGSPWGDGKISSDPTIGDMHQWNVWHGTQEKYQIFDSLGGRFNSEFGMEAFPHIATIKSFVEKEEDLYPQSHVIDFHNKADGAERRIATYLVENVRTATSLEAYIHLTQLIQCEALMFGYRGWRKQWGDDRLCGGALVWQLNDCWPVTSWSICDYYLRRKPAYYAMARVLAPLAIGVRRQHDDWSVTHARQPKTQEWELWAVSSKLEDKIVDIELRFVSVSTGKDIKDKILKTGISLTANGTTNILKGYIDNFQDEPHVLAARMWVDSKLVARDTDWPQPLKYLPFSERGVKVNVKGDDMHVSVQRPVKCLVFEERQGCHLTDSAIDLVPGDDQIITVKGLDKGDKSLDWTYLGAGEQ